MWNELVRTVFRRHNTTHRQQQLGDSTHWAEDAAAEYLQQRGLILKERNFRCKAGEIDLIMSDRDSDLVFVEVRYRRQNRYGSPAESVDRRKQRKLINAARFYLQQRHLTERASCRFDVVAVELNAADVTQAPAIQWLADAFSTG